MVAGLIHAWFEPETHHAIENMVVKLDHETPRIGTNIKKSLKLTKSDAFFPAKKVLRFTSTGFKGWSASTDGMPADVSQLDQLPEKKKQETVKLVSLWMMFFFQYVDKSNFRTKINKSENLNAPTGSMYGVFTYSGHKFTPFM